MACTTCTRQACISQMTDIGIIFLKDILGDIWERFSDWVRIALLDRAIRVSLREQEGNI